jgi:hypothetical protein
MVLDGGLRLRALRVASRLVALSFGLGAILLLAPRADAQQQRVAPRTALVELFTAQGCAACPQANQMLGEIANKNGVIALTFPVDYWDYLGWRDTYARPEFTARQRAYVSRLGLKEIYTPEVVVGGRSEAPAVDLDRVVDLITADARRPRRAPEILITRDGQRIAVGTGARPRGGAEVWLIRYDPMRREVRVRSGENAGKSVVHVNVVRELVRLGAWTGRARVFTAPQPVASGLHTVVIVQGTGGGPVLGLARSI